MQWQGLHGNTCAFQREQPKSLSIVMTPYIACTYLWWRYWTRHDPRATFRSLDEGAGSYVPLCRRACLVCRSRLEVITTVTATREATNTCFHCVETWFIPLSCATNCDKRR